MKKTVLLFTILIISIQTFAQWTEFNWDTITFETPYQYLEIDTSSLNIWEIGTPNKVFFDTAFSIPKAIITDTSNTYPVNNYSFFDLYIGNYNVDWYPDDIFIEIKHKFDTDTLKDGGYITVSYDNGQTWMNIINDTAYVFGETPNQMNMFVENLYSTSDTLFNGEYGFSGNSGDWITTKFSWFYWPVKNFQSLGDTMIIRFNFVSDNIETNNEGWMIDNIRLYSMDLGSGIENKENAYFKIFPNPMDEFATIELNGYHQKVEFEIYNIYGQLIKQWAEYNKRTINFDREKLKTGTYFLKIKTDNNLIGIKKLIIR